MIDYFLWRTKMIELKKGDAFIDDKGDILEITEVSGGISYRWLVLGGRWNERTSRVFVTNLDSLTKCFKFMPKEVIDVMRSSHSV